MVNVLGELLDNIWNLWLFTLWSTSKIFIVCCLLGKFLVNCSYTL